MIKVESARCPSHHQLRNRLPVVSDVVQANELGRDIRSIRDRVHDIVGRRFNIRTIRRDLITLESLGLVECIHGDGRH